MALGILRSFLTRTTLLLLLLISFIQVHAVSDGSDSVCIGNKCYYPINSGSFWGDGVNGGVVRVSQTNTVNGSFTVHRSNICPTNHIGGSLWFMQRFDVGLKIVTLIGGQPYLQWYYPSGQPTGLEGLSAVDTGPHFYSEQIPTEFGSVTYNGLRDTQAYVYGWGHVCYYQGCACENGENNCNCQYNAAFAEVMINTPGVPVRASLNISNFRIGQRVFNPSSNPDVGTLDLVTGKPYAVEVTLSAFVPEAAKRLRAHAELRVNGSLKGVSTNFELGQIQNGSSKIFIFSQEDLSGAKDVTVSVVPTDILAEVFDSSDAATATKTVNFYETQLSLLVSEMAGCAPGVSQCYAPISVDQRTRFQTVIVPKTEEYLPITAGKLTPTYGSSWNLSTPLFKNSIYVDSIALWTKKKLAMKDIGVGLATTDYFDKQGESEPGLITFGTVIPPIPGVAFVSTNITSTLAHEIVHVAGSLGHIGPAKVEGIGTGPSEVWTTGQSLDPAIQLGTLADNIINSGLDTPNMSLDSIRYNYIFNKIREQKVDPKVILLGGIIGPDSRISYYDVIKGESFLDAPVDNPDIEIQGLNSLGQVVSTVRVASGNSIERIYNDGTSKDITTESSVFVATLPDPGSITTFKVLRSGTQILVAPVEKNDLKATIDGLNIKSFNLPKILAKAALRLAEEQFQKYLKAKSKNKLAVARTHLWTVRATLAASLKTQITLDDGNVVKKKDILNMIDVELKTLQGK